MRWVEDNSFPISKNESQKLSIKERLIKQRQENAAESERTWQYVQAPENQARYKKQREETEKKRAVILGIHSNVEGDDYSFTAGHAWLTVTINNLTTSYGLWPDSHPKTVDNGDGTDIRVNMEGATFPPASRFYILNKTQIATLNKDLKKRVAWTYTNTCASWASETLDDVIGVDIDADDYGGFETPRELGKHISALEKKSPTSLNHPATAAVSESSW